MLNRIGGEPAEIMDVFKGIFSKFRINNRLYFRFKMSIRNSLNASYLE